MPCCLLALLIQPTYDNHMFSMRHRQPVTKRALVLPGCRFLRNSMPFQASFQLGWCIYNGTQGVDGRPCCLWASRGWASMTGGLQCMLCAIRGCKCCGECKALGPAAPDRTLVAVPCTSMHLPSLACYAATISSMHLCMCAEDDPKPGIAPAAAELAGCQTGRFLYSGMNVLGARTLNLLFC